MVTSAFLKAIRCSFFVEKGAQADVLQGCLPHEGFQESAFIHVPSLARLVKTSELEP